jgi:hypothetical protein
MKVRGLSEENMTYLKGIYMVGGYFCDIENYGGFLQNDHDRPGLTVTRSGLTCGQLIWAAHLGVDGDRLRMAAVLPKTDGGTAATR